MQGALLLDIIIRESAAILQLLASEDQSLLVWGNALLVLDLRLYIVDSIARFHLKGDGFTRQGLDKAVGGKMLVAIRDTTLRDRDRLGDSHLHFS